LLAAATLAASGCGYYFAASGTGLPADAHTIYVDKFSNHSLITGLDDQFARYIKDEIENHRRLRVVDDPAAADLRLEGEIARDDTAATSYNAVVEPTQYNEMLFVTATLRDTRSGRVIWSARDLNASDYYGVVAPAVVPTTPEFLAQNFRQPDLAKLPDAQVAATQKAAAEDQIMSQLAHNLYASMSEGF
jgi:Lipopolysaccharide-assembly